MVDVALSDQGMLVSAEALTRAKVLGRLRLGDTVFRHLTRAAAIGVLLLLSGVIISLIIGSLAGTQNVRLWLPVQPALESGHREIRSSPGHLRHDHHLVHRHVDRGSGGLDDRLLPHRAMSAMAAAADRHRGRTARRHPQHHLRHLGPVHVRPIPAANAATVSDRYARQRTSDRAAVLRPAVRHWHPDLGPDSRHHGAAVRDLDLARRVRGGARRCSRRPPTASAAPPGR